MIHGHKTSRWSRLALFSVLAVCLAAPAAQAQELSKAAASLELVPGDVPFYSVSLRNREQLEAVLASKAWAKLTKLPFAQMAWQYLEDALDQPGPLAQLKEWYGQEENRELVRLLGDLVSDEVFSYGGKNTADFFALAGEVYLANQLAPLKGLLEGRNPRELQSPQASGRAVLRALANNLDRLKAPDLVTGFKLRDSKRAQAQLKRLDQLVKALSEQEPKLKGRWTKSKIGQGDYYTFKFDGSLVPWDMVPWAFFEDNPGEFDDLQKKLRGLELTVNIGFHGSFLIVAVGETSQVLQGLGGKGQRLADREEFRPLAKFADRKVTSINYASKEWQALQSPRAGDVNDLAKNVLEGLKGLDLTKAQKERIQKDLKALARDFEKYFPEPGAAFSFSFLTATGSENYSYDWSKGHGLDTSKPLTILQHVGGSPLIVAAERHVPDPDAYKLLSKWAKIGWGYVEELAIPRLPEEVKEQYEAVMKEARPILKRLDKVTGEMLVPALAEGQGALVLDAKLKSKQWHRAMPEANQPLPMLELALVFGVKDAELLTKAMGEYRKIANDAIAVIGKFVPRGAPDITIPPPEIEKIKGGTLYFYSLPPEAGFDEQLTPTAGLSDRFATLTLSRAHATRLLQPTPLKAGGKFLTDTKRPDAASFAHVNWEGLVNAAAPWVDYALTLAPIDDNGQNIRGQVRTVMEVLKVFRSHTSVTYAENGAIVRHGRTIIRDID